MTYSMRITMFAFAAWVALFPGSEWAPAQQPPAESVEIESAEIDSALVPYKPEAVAKGTVTISGPGDYTLLVNAWTQDLQKIHPELKVVCDVADPAEASQQLREGKRQLVMMVRTMRAEEIAAFEKVHKAPPVGINVGVGAGAVIVHPSNPLPAISFEALEAVYSATPRRGASRTALTWGELGLEGEWANRKITPVIRSAGSAIHTGISELVLVRSKFAEHVRYMDPTAKVVDFVAGEPLAMGVSTSWAADKKRVKVVPLLSVQGKPTLPTVDAILDGHYPLVRPLVCYVKYAKGDPAPPPEVAEFLRYAQSREGQISVRDAGALPLPRGLIEANFALYDELGLRKKKD